MDLKNILILTELDALSAKVTGFAINLAVQMSIPEIVLLNVIIPANTPAFSASGDVFTSEGNMADHFNLALLEKHQRLVNEEAARLTNEMVQVKPIVRFNNSKTDLNGYMEEFQAGLLVCGSRDENTFLEKLFGSDREKIIRKVDYPVIFLKEDTDTDEINNILVAIDIDEEDQSGLKEIVGFAHALKARMQLLHVLTDEANSSEYAIERLRTLAIKNMFGHYDINVVNNDSLENGIRNFVRKNNPEMIAVLSQGKGKIKKLIFGSNTNNIIKESDKPVFVSKLN
ncbi:MAG: universal stress protein [Bacteroidales bacterium]|nr:universal stress protein [Bacteroidales bacterium]